MNIALCMRGFSYRQLLNDSIAMAAALACLKFRMKK